MGKVIGFLEFECCYEVYEVLFMCVKYYKEFVVVLIDVDVKVQGVCCMDCGILFCNNGCLVNNIILDFNDFVYCQDWQQVIEVLYLINNFLEFMGCICLVLCEVVCMFGINNDLVGIKLIEYVIIDKVWVEGWVKLLLVEYKMGKKVVVVGLGFVGFVVVQQFVCVGYDVMVFEKNDCIGGLLCYGIFDFKFEKWLIDCCMCQMEVEGVMFCISVFIGKELLFELIGSFVKEIILLDMLKEEFDVVVIVGGLEMLCDLLVLGCEFVGVYFVMDFLLQQNCVNVGDKFVDQLFVKGKYVIVIGGGDMGLDCVGMLNCYGVKQVMQFELLLQLLEEENKLFVWLYWLIKLCMLLLYEEGCECDWVVVMKCFEGKNGKVEKLIVVCVEWKDGKMQEVLGFEFEMKVDFVLFVMGFMQLVVLVFDVFGVVKDVCGNVCVVIEGDCLYYMLVDKVFVVGDMCCGQLFVVWVICEGCQCVCLVDVYLMGYLELLC